MSDMSKPVPQNVGRAHTADINVLIDGYNLQMPNGTGIKNYTYSLVEALQYLDFKTFVLTSLQDSRDSVLSEVLFADERASEGINLRGDSSVNSYVKNTFKLIKYMAKLLVGKPCTVRFSGKVIFGDSPLQGLLKSDQVLNLEGAYDAARILHRLIQQQTTIRCGIPIDIWHRTYPLLPLKVHLRRPKANVLTICDVIPLKLPYLTRDRKDEYYRTLKTVLKDKPFITTISEQSRQDILEFFDIDPDRIVVTYLPIAPTPLTCNQNNFVDSSIAKILNYEQLSRFLSRYRLKPQQYFLFVGNVEPRKNLLLLLKAYLAIHTSFPLVIVGKLGWKSEQDLAFLQSMLGSNWYRRVKLLNFVHTNELPYLYQGAFSLVFPSLYEGFGMPPVEAMSWGCPVITSDRSSLPEVCGEAALYFNPYDVNDLQNNMEKLLNDDILRTKLIHAGIAKAKQFSLESFSGKLWGVYSQLLQ
jgi:glycosyltransferase involved in cell wall biosynthesis